MQHRQVMSKLRQELDEARRHPGPVYGLPTGISCVDLRTGGLHPGELTIVGGRPGHGKTVFGTQVAYEIAYHAWRQDLPGHVLYFSAEMPAARIAARELARQTGISIRRQRAGDYSEEEYDILLETMAGLEELPMEIDDRAGVDIDVIRETVKAHQHQGGVILLVVDHLQLITKHSSSYSTYQAVNYTVDELRKLRDLINAPIVVLSQLRRADRDGEQSTRRPEASELRDSGMIEATANNVYLLYNPPPEDLEEEEKPRTAELLVRKARDGSTGTIILHFDPTRVCFTNPAPQVPKLVYHQDRERVEA